MLPPSAPDFEDFQEVILRGSMNTAKEVGGDFYDYFPIDENRICLDSTKEEPGEKTLERILADINVFSEGVPQFDDITMVVMTIKK